jgi:hydrogenase/urease accessory protein HupE
MLYIYCMSDFELYFRLGWRHITDWQGYDHMLFVVALCVIYSWTQWRRIAWLLTAFTVGHSITLALSTLNILEVNSTLIEFLIPITIVFTAFYNIFVGSNNNKKSDRNGIIQYCTTAGFGLVHGLGFSNYLRSLLGGENSLLLPLFSFNVGLEVGQLLIVAVLLAISWLIKRLFAVTERDFRLVVLALVAGMALVLVLNTDYLKNLTE